MVEQCSLFERDYAWLAFKIGTFIDRGLCMPNSFNSFSDLQIEITNPENAKVLAKCDNLEFLYKTDSDKRPVLMFLGVMQQMKKETPEKTFHELLNTLNSRLSMNFIGNPIPIYRQ
jgi:hypothetical protein